MSVYMIADIKVTDDTWVPAYAASVHDLVHKHGGKYLARSRNVKTLEGKPLDTSFIAVIQFPSAKAVEGFLADPKYAPYAAARKDGSESRFPADRRHRCGRDHFLPAQRINDSARRHISVCRRRRGCSPPCRRDCRIP